MAKKKDLSIYVVSQDTAKWIDLKRDLELLRDRLCEMYEETVPEFFSKGFFSKDEQNDRALQKDFDTAFENIHKFINRGLCSSIDTQMSISLDDKII